MKGSVKGKVGEVVGNDNRRAEGEARQGKGKERTAETKDRAVAKEHEKKAEPLSQEQAALEN